MSNPNMESLAAIYIKGANDRIDRLEGDNKHLRDGIDTLQRRNRELEEAAAATLDAIDNVLNGADEHGRSKLAAAAELLAKALPTK